MPALVTSCRLEEMYSPRAHEMNPQELKSSAPKRADLLPAEK